MLTVLAIDNTEHCSIKYIHSLTVSPYVVVLLHDRLLNIVHIQTPPSYYLLTKC